MPELSPDPDELARALAAIEHRGQVNIALSDDVSETGMTRVWDLASVARTALRDTGRIAQLEAETAYTNPAAASRLRLIADVAAVCIAGLVAHTARALLTGARDPLAQSDTDTEGEDQ